MDEEFTYVCECGAELPPNHEGPCPECGKSGEIHKAYERKLTTAAGLDTRMSSRTRQKGKGFSKFKKEIEQGWFTSEDSELKNGVDKVRIVDKEHDEYYEITKNVMTGEITHKINEPLSQHFHMKSKKEEERNLMGTKGRKNVKKPKQKGKKGEPKKK